MYTCFTWIALKLRNIVELWPLFLRRMFCSWKIVGFLLRNSQQNKAIMAFFCLRNVLYYKTAYANVSIFREDGAIQWIRLIQMNAQ